MSVFTGPMIIEEVQPGRLWRLVSPILYEAGAEGSGQWIEVPNGFVTDGASIPPALRTVLAVWGTYGRAACLHDYLYSVLKCGWLWQSAPGGFDAVHPAFVASGIVGMGIPMTEATNEARRWADAEFHTAMIACGTSRPLAWIIWAAVRMFGGHYARR